MTLSLDVELELSGKSLGNPANPPNVANTSKAEANSLTVNSCIIKSHVCI